ncbi:MAG: relaxase/mobilization nuclease domain-containing protein [Oscillospiraceae bacterium]|nr:relaxase/mobilization nuclease domain-containing protein [Oscillospiraceae bacterium]
MAVTKTHPIKSTLKAAIDYICDPTKTDGKLLVSSFGCTAETADIEFAWTRSHAIDKGENLGRHLIQAFSPGEVSPEEAHEIGMQLAKEVLGGKYEFVLTTHIDKGHIHNHLLFNAVSFVDHRHYHSNKRSYHFIRRTSDRLCKEHGLSVIVPGQDKGKSYIEHQAAKAGTSYKAKLKAAIDRVLPTCSGLEDLLFRLQREGYEIKRGKYISCRAPDQERFTRLKTLGIDYTEEALASRIAGGSRPSRQPKPRDGKIDRLIDIRNSAKAQESAGFAHWATLQNLKEGARTVNFLTEHGIDSFAALEQKLSELTEKKSAVHSSIKETEQRMTEISLVMKHAATYRQLKPLYDEYRKSRDKEKFLRGHESEIIIFEAAARELKRLGAVPLPTTASMKAELTELKAKKETLRSELTAVTAQLREFETIKQNMEILVSSPQKEQDQTPDRRKRHQLE